MKPKTIWRIFMLGTDKEYERKKLEEGRAIFNEKNKGSSLQSVPWDDDDDDYFKEV